MSKQAFKSKKNHGIVLIMALYITAVVFALATFFVADQLSKSKTVGDYKDGKLALEGADLGLNYVVNYLGDLRDHWANSLVITDPGGDRICGKTGIEYLGNALDITDVNFGTALVVGTGLRENDYAFNLRDPIAVSHIEKKVAIVHGTLRVFYFPGLATGKGCAGLASDSPYALSHVEIELASELTDPGKKTASAARQIQWSGRRTLGLFSAFYQCWSCWDIPGSKYPNHTEKTDSAAFVGNGYLASGPIAGIGQTAPFGVDRSEIPTQSPYGAESNGVVQVTSDAGNGLPPAPQFNNLAMAYGNIDIAGNAKGVLDGKVAQNTGDAIPLVTGAAWGPASVSGKPGSSPGTAAAAMLNAFNSASSDSACSGNLKTVFVTSSSDVGPGIPGGTGHDIEYPGNLAKAQKPGYAITDVSLNSNQTVTINRLGYYSGAKLYSETFNPSQLQNGVIYVQGGNVRVHGDLKGAGLSIVGNQGEAFFDDHGHNITPASATGCFASNPNLGQPVPLTNAARFSSLSGGPSSQGVDYWIPQPGAPPGCEGDWNACAKVYASNPESNINPNCSLCLYDGFYQTGTNPDGSKNVIGYHVDDVNGEPQTLNPDKFFSAGGNWQTTDSASFNNTIFAPRPEYSPTNGSFADNTFIDKPTPVQLLGPGGGVVAQKMFWPYPGASALVDLQNNSNMPDDLFYTRQFEDSEGNLTLAGDTTYEGVGAALGLMAQNYVFLNDFVAGDKSNRGDYQMQVRSTVVSAHNSIQWEGNLPVDPRFGSDTFINGDYTAINGQYGDGTPYQYHYTDQNNLTHLVAAGSAEGAPLTGHSPLSGQPGNGQFWTFKFTGLSSAPYQDVVGNNLNGNNAGYLLEQLSSDRNNEIGNPNGLPTWSFARLQTIGLPAFYATLSYADLGALHAGP